MTIQNFIERGIEGGYKEMNSSEIDEYIGEFFLDPLAWQAVGKVEGWKGYYNTQVFRAGKPHSTGGERLDKKEVYARWQYEMHSMVDALAEGKTLEEYIATL